MSWQVALAFFFVLNTAQALWQRVYSQKSQLPESFPPALSYLFVFWPLSLVVGLLAGPSIKWSAWVIFLLVVEGALIGLFNWLMFRAIKRLPVATFQLIFQLYNLITITLGWVLLSEKLSLVQIFGGILILTAALIATQAPADRDGTPKAHRKLGVILTLLAAVCLGVGLISEKAALGYMNVGAYFIFGFLTQALALGVIALKDIGKQAIAGIRRGEVWRLAIMGTLSATAGFFYIYAVQHSDNISLITALSAFCLPLAVLAAYAFLKERENIARMLLAAALGTVGIIVTTL
jgi:drug/metabolite transporter (DMT)-like permease